MICHVIYLTKDMVLDIKLLNQINFITMINNLTHKHQGFQPPPPPPYY